MRFQFKGKRKHKDLWIVIIIITILLLYTYYEANFGKKVDYNKANPYLLVL